MIKHLFLYVLLPFHRRTIAIAVVAMFVLSSCDDGGSQTQSNNDQQAHDVEVSKIEQQTLPVILPVPGTVVSKERLKVASRITGFIEKITVDEGDIVKPGDTLVEIDNAQIEAAIKGADAAVLAAKADLLDAKDDVKRIKKLVKSKTMAEDDLRNAEVRRAQTKATLATAEAEVVAKRQDRRYSHIISPVHAQVRERLRDPGDLAAAGELILQLDVLGDMELEVYLPSTSISSISVGQSVNVRVKSCDELLTAKVYSIVIVRAADEVTRRYKVRLLLPPDDNLTPGQFGQAQFVLGKKNVIVVPASAITERAGIEGVFVKDVSNKLYFRSVRLGKIWQPHDLQAEASQAMREVLSGLEVETLVVTNPTALLRDGEMAR
jgi:RND family efflux transporter MFP subunit